jgi:signal transduction histidine kinase
VEFRVPFPDGTTHWVAGNGQVFVDAAGAPARMIGIGRDVTERKAAEVERERLFRETEEAVKVRDTFLSVAGHEFRTPLGALTLTLHNLARKARLENDELMLSGLGTVERQVQRLVRLTDDLLEVGRINAGKIAFEAEPTDLPGLVREVAQRLEEPARRAGSAFELNGTQPVVGLWDRSRLDQVVTNLLSNAIKFGEGRPIAVTVDADAGSARLMVRDQGIGISPEDQARIFERFERAVSGRSYGGIGLGLWITREIVQHHGGTVTVKSEPGEGATFVVQLPLAGSAPPPPAG